VMCPFLTPAMLRKFINQVVEATCSIVRCCYITVDSEMVTSQNRACTYQWISFFNKTKKLSLAKSSMLYTYITYNKAKESIQKK
jgi:hypothetical protein